MPRTINSFPIYIGKNKERKQRKVFIEKKERDERISDGALLLDINQYHCCYS